MNLNDETWHESCATAFILAFYKLLKNNSLVLIPIIHAWKLSANILLRPQVKIILQIYIHCFCIYKMTPW